MKLLHSDITDDIIKAFYEVYTKLGYGFLEKVYEHSMAYVLKRMNHDVRQQYPTTVYFESIIVGEYYADLVVDGKVIIELKAVNTISQEHEAQILNYLKASRIEVGLLLNFGKKPEFRRKIFSNSNK